MRRFCSGASVLVANHPKTMSTFGTNSCASAAGTMKYPKYWHAGKLMQQCPIDQIFKQRFNLSMPTKAGCQNPGRVGALRRLDAARGGPTSAYSANLSTRAA